MTSRDTENYRVSLSEQARLTTRRCRLYSREEAQSMQGRTTAAATRRYVSGQHMRSELIMTWFFDRGPGRNWVLTQGNQHSFRLLLDPDAGGQPHFTGMAHQEHQSGKVTGGVHQEKVVFQIEWGDGKVGQYEGFRHQDRILRGITWENGSGAAPVDWWSERDQYWNPPPPDPPAAFGG